MQDVMTWCDLLVARDKEQAPDGGGQDGDLFKGVPDSEMVRTKGW